MGLITLYFLWQGRAFNPTMRYFLPIYPPLILFAAWGSIWLWETAGRRMRQLPRQWLARRAMLAATPLLIVLTFAWGWGFSRIYTRPHSRITANRWVINNVPQGSVVTNEAWDGGDALHNNANVVPVELYTVAEDEPAKYLGRMNNGELTDGLINSLGKADYVAMTSARAYGTLVRLPQRFPAIVRYYQAMFDGSLGFEPVLDVASFPTFLGMPINDTGADEAFTVYDHPRVLIFHRTASFNPDQAQRLIMDGVVWDEIYQTSAKQTNDAPTTLRLTDKAWAAITSHGADFVLLGPSGPLAVLVWLVALELLGLATFALLWRLDVPLRDRGLGLSRPLGLLLLTAVPSLITSKLGLGRGLWAGWYGVLLLAGILAAVRDRRALRQWLALHRRDLAIGQALYAAALVVGLAVRLLHPSFSATATDQLRLAHWNALVGSAALPPFDPLFAGGQLTVPFAALLPAAALAKITGVQGLAGLNLAVATLFALLATTVWAALARVRRPAATRRPLGGDWWAPVAGALLALAPGVGSAASRGWSAVGALLGGDAAQLGGLLLLALSVTLGLNLVRCLAGTTLRRSLPLAALWLVALALLAGHSPTLALVAWLPLLGAGLALLAFRRLQWLGLAGAVGVAALIAGRLWSWSIAPAVNLAPVTLPPGTLLLSSGLSLALAMLFLLRATRRHAESGLVWIVGGLLVAWSALVVWAVSSLRAGGTLAKFVSGETASDTGLAKLLADLGLLLTKIASGPAVFVPALMALIWAIVVTVLPDRRRPTTVRPRSGERQGLTQLFLSLGAVLALLFAGRVTAGTSGDSLPLLAAGAGVLLSLVAGQALLVMSRGQRPAARLGGVAAGGLAFALVLVALLGVRELPRNPQPWSLAAPSDDTTAALAAISADSRGLPLVAAASAADGAGTVNTLPATALQAGFPTLMTNRQLVDQQRAFVAPSVDRVIDGRLRALDGIYGADPNLASSALRTYHIDYVLVGPAERSRYSTAGEALERLVGQGTLQALPDTGAVRVFKTRTSVDADPPPFVAVKPTLEPPTTRGLLDRPLKDEPVVDDYGWNTVASNLQPLAVLIWLLLFEGLGLLVWPLTRRIFGRWHGGGWAWSKLLGLLVWGYVVWLLTSMHAVTYSWVGWLLGLVIVTALTLAAGGWRPGIRLRNFYRRGLREFRDDIVTTEALFVMAFVFWVFIRALNPDLWHPSLGGEKPFEFGFLNAILRSPYMPPADPFFSGGTINYYYYGLYLVSLPMKVTGIAPAIAFNLAVAMLFALVVTGAAAVVRELTGRWRYGALGAIFVTCLGPIGSVVQLGSSKGLGFLLNGLYPGGAGIEATVNQSTGMFRPLAELKYVLTHMPHFAEFGARIGDWFWGPSRLIDLPASRTINEFPLFSYLFADLHPHMIVLPFTIFTIGLAVELTRRAGIHGHQTNKRQLFLPLALGALLVGTLAAANSWDAPAYALLLGGTLVGGAWRVARLQRLPWHATLLKDDPRGAQSDGGAGRWAGAVSAVLPAVPRDGRRHWDDPADRYRRPVHGDLWRLDVCRHLAAAGAGRPGGAAPHGALPAAGAARRAVCRAADRRTAHDRGPAAADG